MASVAIRFTSFREHLKEYRGVYYAWATIFVAAILAVRAFGMGQGNLVAIVALLVTALIWVVVAFLCSRDEISLGLASEQRRAIREQYARERLPYIRGGEIATTLLLGTLCFGYAWGDVWVAPGDTTSLSRSLWWMPPFVGPTVYSVGEGHAQTGNLVVITKDGVPLSCRIDSSGINLDRRNPAKLESFLLSVAERTDPERYLNGEVTAALVASASAVLSTKSSEQVSRQGRFLIPYQIGTPMGDTLQRNLLRWSDGSVTFSCTLSKFQN